jgi:BASS family bile acid:Na+ symporter
MDSCQKLGSFISRNMIVVVPLCLVAGICLPGLFIPFKPFISAMFAVITFQGSLSNDFGNLKRTFRHPLPMISALIVSQVFMPLLAWALGHLFFSDTDLICGIVLEYSVPIAVTATMWVSMYNGDMSLTLGTVLISTCLAPFTIPATLQLLMGATVHVDAAGMILDMLKMIAIPALLGTALNDKSHGRAKKELSPVLAPLARILTIIVITTNSTSLHDFIFNLTPELMGVLVLIAFLASSGYVWGFLMAKALHLKRDPSVSMTFCCAMKNISAGAIIAQEYFPAITLFPVMTGTLFNQFFAALFGKLFGKAFAKMQIAEAEAAAAQKASGTKA